MSDSLPPVLIGRAAELQQISQIFAADSDLMVVGVPGSGRRSLIGEAVQRLGGRLIDIDCLRATTSSRFLELLAEKILEVFSDPAELADLERWVKESPLILEPVTTNRYQLAWQVPNREEWQVLKALLTLPQILAEQFGGRVVFLFQNFPHIRSWDRSGQWETYLRQEVHQQSRVNYVILATVAESWGTESKLPVLRLPPLPRKDLQLWLVDAFLHKGLKFDPDALDLFLNYMQGHPGSAITLAQRLWLEYQATEPNRWKPTGMIQVHHVQQAMWSLVEDLSLTFEALLLLLPPIQARVLESLAIDPTDSPHARSYVRKHQLSRGGGLQGALAGLEQKGLLYGAEDGYRLAMPLLAFWLKHRLS